MRKFYRDIALGIGMALMAGLSLAQGPADNASFFVTNETATDENGDTPACLMLVDGQAQRGDALLHDVLTGSN